MIDDSVLRRQGCGLYRCPAVRAPDLMPDLWPLFESVPIRDGVIDVKIHMLMPGQWPCIPNWHYDFVPRDEGGRQMMHARDPGHAMWLLVSGPPFTEFEDGRSVKPWVWTRFTQYDLHRGHMSRAHCWRLFARVWRPELCPAAPHTQWARRHSQTYLDAEGFTW